MKIRKSLVVLFLLSFGLTGCYTQLEYSQRVQRITDEKPVEGYAWSEDEAEEEGKANLTVADSIYIAETYGAKVDPYREGEGEFEDYADEEYIPVEYKDYSVLEQYEECGCDPYKTYVINNYNYYPSSWYHWSPYYSYYRPFHSWHWRFHLGWHYYHNSFGFATYWGVPYYYYDPFFYDPFYYGYGYYGSIYYSTYYFSSYAGNVRYDRSDRRYGRRSIGADRVRDRSGSAVRGNRTAVTRNRATTTTTRLRGRSTSVDRSRGTIRNTGSSTTRSRATTRTGRTVRPGSDSGSKARGTIGRSGSRNSGSSKGSRSRTGVDRDRNNDQSSVSTRGLRDYNSNSRRTIILPPATSRAELQERISRQRAKTVEADHSRRSSYRKSLLDRLNNFFKHSGGSVNLGKNSSRSSRSYSFPSRSKTGRSTFGRSRSSSSSSRSTVTRSRSSSKSSSTRSRGSSSNNRSRNNN